MTNAMAIVKVHHDSDLAWPTDNLEAIGKQDDVLGSPRFVRQVAKQGPGEQAAQAERW